MGIDKKIDSKIGTDESYPIKNQSTSKIIESHEIKIPGKIYSKRKIHNNQIPFLNLNGIIIYQSFIYQIFHNIL